VPDTRTDAFADIADATPERREPPDRTVPDTRTGASGRPRVSGHRRCDPGATRPGPTERCL